MNENSLDASRLTLESADGTTIAGVHSYDPASFMWKFEPGSSLSAGGTYTATVSAGVTDSFGVAMISDVQWQFTAGTSIDNTGPQVVATWPAAPCQCSPPTTRIVLLADEPLDPTATLVVLLGNGSRAARPPWQHCAGHHVGIRDGQRPHLWLLG